MSWPTVPLDRCIASIRAGVSLSGDNRTPREGEVGVLTLSAVANGRFAPEKCKALPAAAATELGDPVKAGTLLMSRSNTIDLVGSTALVEEDHPDRFLPDLLWEIILRGDSPVDAGFLADYLASGEGRALLQSAAMGTSGSMKKLSMGRVRALKVPVVPAALQRTWFRVRRVLNARETLLTRQIAAKRALKSGLMEELLTGRRRLPSVCGSRWTDSPLADLFSERAETGHPSLRLLSVTADRGIIPRDAVDRKDTSNADKSKYQRVRVGDIAYNTMRMWQGVSALSAYEGIVSPAYTVLVPRGALLARYARHLFKLPRVIHTFWSFSQGLVDDTLTLKYPRLARISVRHPTDLAEQSRIADVLDCLDRELELLERLRAAHEVERRALMQRLLSGEVIVPSSDAPELEPVHA